MNEEQTVWDNHVRWGLHKWGNTYTVMKYTGRPDYEHTYYGEPGEITIEVAATNSRASALAVLRLFEVTEGMDLTQPGGWDVWGKILPFREDSDHEKPPEPWKDRSRDCPHCFQNLDEDLYA